MITRGKLLLGAWLCLAVNGLVFEPVNAEAGFRIQRGTNISHWLSQSKRRGEERKVFFTRKDVHLLAGLGFDHLRIPVDEEQLWAEDGSKEPAAWQLLDAALDWCAEAGLRAVVDLHILRSHHFNEAEKPLWTQPAAQERFLDCWRQLSSHLKSRPVSLVAYEPMNEPVADDPEEWNRLIGRVIAVIRENEPERVVIVGSNRWQSADTFDQLRIPEGDRNIILSFHFYTPFLLTHYKAGWTNIRRYEGQVRYPGWTVLPEDVQSLPVEVANAIKPYNGNFDRAELEKRMEKPLALARKTGLPLYCGEWGCLPSVPREDRLRWYRDMRSILESHGIAWATWDYKGGFGLVSGTGELDEEFIAVLVK